MSKKEPGYIFILTNPSFKEDWIKIIESDRPTMADSISWNYKELPLPYSLFASIKFDNFVDGAYLFAKFKAKTSKAILNKSCFFNTTPKEALDTLCGLAYFCHFSMQISIYADELIYVQTFDRGVPNLLVIDENEIKKEENDIDDDGPSAFGWGDFDGGWTDSELEEACDAAYEGHSRLELGLD